MNKTVEKILIAILVILGLPMFFLIVSISSPCGSDLRKLVDPKCVHEAPK